MALKRPSPLFRSRSGGAKGAPEDSEEPDATLMERVPRARFTGRRLARAASKSSLVVVCINRSRIGNRNNNNSNKNLMILSIVALVVISLLSISFNELLHTSKSSSSSLISQTHAYQHKLKLSESKPSSPITTTTPKPTTTSTTGRNSAPNNSSNAFISTNSFGQLGAAPAAGGSSKPLEKRNSSRSEGQAMDNNIGLNKAASYLLGEQTDRKLDENNELDRKLWLILQRRSPDMRPLREFRDFNDISLEVAQRAWSLMHSHALSVASDRMETVWPAIESSLRAAKVSRECFVAATKTSQAVKRLESWAIQLLNAWGSFPPAGLYEGTYGDIGSFHGCVNVPENSDIGHAHFCTIAYKPVLPTRKSYELIIKKEDKSLLNFFELDNDTNFNTSTATNRSTSSLNSSSSSNSSSSGSSRVKTKDAFSDLLKHAHYNHYVYYKFGTCFPIQCSPFDVRKLANLLGRRSILMNGPIKCHSKYADDYENLKVNANDDDTGQPVSNKTVELKISTRDLNDGIFIWKPHITRAQWISLVLVSLITLIIIIASVIHGITCLRAHLSSDQSNAPSGSDVRRSDSSSKRKTTDVNNNNSNNNNKLNKVNNGDFKILRPNNQSEVELSELRAKFNGSDTFKTIPLNDDDQQAEEVDKEKNNQAQQQLHQHQLEGLASGQSLATSNHAIQSVAKGRATGAATVAASRGPKKTDSALANYISDFSIFTNACQFFKVNQSQLKNDILCLNGLRCLTMSWIVITHTMQYNDWSAFARTREIETHLRSLVNQPLFNGSYLVDTFFLISGLLTSFSTFKSHGGLRGTLARDFSPKSYLIGRYLRLTPQVILISMLFILLPLLKSQSGGGPHWYTITGEYSENCAENWWINVLQIQAFYKSNEMCNFVCWWISVDMFYHLFALLIIMLVLQFGKHMVLKSCLALVLPSGLYQAFRHYNLKLPPNILSTIPQTGAMWSEMTLDFFWMPYAHALPSFLGFYVGFLMAEHSSPMAAWFTLRRSLAGWTLAVGLLLAQSYSTYFWVVGDWSYSPLVATIFYTICPYIWATCLVWIIIACHFGHGSVANSILTCRLFVILGKASYIVYLSHFLVLFTFYGSQNLLLEPTQLLMLYIMIGNICLSMAFGCLLCIVYEMPWLRLQRRIMRLINATG